MENQPLLDDPGSDPRRRKSARTSLVARPQYIEVPSPGVIEEPSPGLLVEYWDILRRHRGTLIAIAFLGLLSSLLFTLPQIPSTGPGSPSKIQNLNENFLNMRDVSPTANARGSYPPYYDIQTQMKILQRIGHRAVLAKLNRARDAPEKERGRLSAWRHALGLAKRDRTPGKRPR